MRVLILTLGSRGDVQPMAALGIALRARGHRVMLSVGENYKPWIESVGLDHAPGGPDLQKVILDGGEGLFNPIAFMKKGDELSREVFEAQLQAARALSPDVIVAGALCFGAGTLRELFGCKVFWASFFPGTYRSDDYGFPLFPAHLRSRFWRRISWSIGMWTMDRIALGSANRLRSDLGLGPIRSMEKFLHDAGPALHAVDARVAPVPPDWPLEGLETGFWFLDDRTSLPPEVEAFLEAGPPPIYAGFGSMPIADARDRTRAIVEGVEAAGARALISTGWANLGDLGKEQLPPSCLRIGPVSHTLLFPRVAAVLHHGGAGTTAATLKAGVPHIPVPHGFDQFTWAERVYALGVAAKPLHKRFRGPELAEAITACAGDEALKSRAAELGEHIRRSRGVERAVEILEAAA